MSDRHLAHWPPQVPLHLDVPATHLYANVDRAVAQSPDKPYLIFYDSPLSFRRFKDETEKLAGYLQQVCGVQAGDRVLLFMQNSPQFALAYYAILRADAVVVPVNPMNMTDELRHYVEDSGARTAISEKFQSDPGNTGCAGGGVTIAFTGKISSATVGDGGTIEVRGGTMSTSIGQGVTITVTPTYSTATGTITWSCVGSPAKYMPATCR